MSSAPPDPGPLHPGWVDLDLLIKDARTMKPLPVSTTRLAALVLEEDWDLRSVAEVVRLDQALTGRLLGSANSVLAGARHEITSIDQAILRLGPGTVLAIAIGSTVGEMLGDSLPAYGLSEGELWRHSVAAAFAMEAARRHCRVTFAPEAFAAALLHDVGKLVLARYLDPDAVAVVRRVCQESGLDDEEVERELLHLPHAEVGARIAEGWGLPPAIAMGIRFHHTPLYAPDEESRKLCTQIALADVVAHAIGAPCGAGSAGGEPGTIDPGIASLLGITRQGFEDLCVAVAADLDEAVAAFGGASAAR